MDILMMQEKMDQIIEIMKDNEEVENMALLATVIDWFAGTTGKKGYEVIDVLLPVMKQVGDELGVME